MSDARKTTETTLEDVDAQGFHYERILCPCCGATQTAKVEHTGWNSFVHTCQECFYVIGESEWDKLDTI